MWKLKIISVLHLTFIRLFLQKKNTHSRFATLEANRNKEAKFARLITDLEAEIGEGDKVNLMLKKKLEKLTMELKRWGFFNLNIQVEVQPGLFLFFFCLTEWWQACGFSESWVFFHGLSWKINK